MAALTSEGIVLTADSRQTYVNLAKATRIGTDNATKVFKLSKKVGVVIAGTAFALDEKKSLKSLGWFIDQFAKHELKKANTISIKGIRDQLLGYLNKKNIANVSFVVAGYGPDGIGHAYLACSLTTPNDNTTRDTNTGGFLRVGQDDVVTRVMNGWSPALLDLDFVKKAQQDNVDIFQELNKAQYIVNWGTITLQDAIDFCVLMTKTTENVQRFSDGTWIKPGDIAGVGGPVDVAIIRPDDTGFTWLQEKELHVDES